MKKLTGRAAEDFKGWLFSTRNEVIKVGVMEYDLYYMFMYMLQETCKDSLIIEWFDSVGIKIIIIPTMFADDWGCDIFGWTNCIKEGLNSRTEAINIGILKANELYNLNN